MPKHPKKRDPSTGRTAKQQAALDERARAADLTRAQTKAEAEAAQLAQIVNLQIAGYSLADIGAAIGASAEEVDRRLNQETTRYVRNQPALRTYVRNYVSGRYSELLDTVWDAATDKAHPRMLDHQDRAVRILERMAKLHGADAPTQTEVKVEAAPEAVEKLVQALSAQRGYDYDDSVFDVVEAEVVHEAVQESAHRLEESSNAVEDDDETDRNWDET